MPHFADREATMVGHTALWAFMYEPELPQDIDEAREILEKYSKIPAEQIDQHLHTVVWLSLSSGESQTR